MSILFSVVARRNIVLARHAEVVGNFSEVTEQLLAKIDSTENLKKSFSHGKYLYHYASHNGLIFLCIAGKVLCHSPMPPCCLRSNFLMSLVIFICW